MDYSSEGIEVLTSSGIKKSLADEGNFFNLVNLLHPGDPDIHRVQELYDENALLRLEISRLNSRSEELLLLSEQRRRERDEIESSSLLRQRNLEEELNLLEQELLRSTHELENRIRAITEESRLNQEELSNQSRLRQEELENELRLLQERGKAYMVIRVDRQTHQKMYHL